MKIDAFCHVLPRPYFERLQSISNERAANLLKRTAPIRTLWDLDERLRVIEPFDDYAGHQPRGAGHRIARRAGRDRRPGAPGE